MEVKGVPSRHQICNTLREYLTSEHSFPSHTLVHVGYGQIRSICILTFKILLLTFSSPRTKQLAIKGRILYPKINCPTMLLQTL